jgi:hypothetical protein
MTQQTPGVDIVQVTPLADGSFRIALTLAGQRDGRPHVWTPTRRELKQLAREGRTPYEEALRRGQRALEFRRTITTTLTAQ